ncbi:hypothetical protein [Paraburkholderia sp. BCC1885]|uniref:hypothetical protein n=1 Tax=Paraburkholderia sp. BCC1885 TaxID=2562669 RepID=UPI001183647D|nr:hypothetical protein [Paraburkholderia sp. BCC1885]
MADSAASTQSRTTRASSTRRRANTVSTETENKLARAARSAQRLAQLSDPSRDDVTLDLFPDDPTRATLEAMNIDVRQGTLHGFELPDVVLAAVGVPAALDAVAGASSDTRAARRAPREKVEPAYASVPLDGFERVEPAQKVVVDKDADFSDLMGANGGPAVETVDAPATTAPEGSQTARPVGPTLVSPSMAAASLVRSVTARRQPVEPASALAADVADNAAGVETARLAEGSSARETAASTAASTVASGEAIAAPAPSPATNTAPAFQDTPPTPPTPPTAPELDRARATAFADTVDALYGVISDQRRAATDHSRRMKWMLSIVVGALLATVAIGVTQTWLLMRLTRETTAQQHRIEQLMQNQQAAMTSLLDAHLAAAAAAATPPAVATPAVAPRTPAAAPTATPAPASRHKVRAQPTHAHKPKAAPTR